MGPEEAEQELDGLIYPGPERRENPDVHRALRAFATIIRANSEAVRDCQQQVTGWAEDMREIKSRWTAEPSAADAGVTRKEHKTLWDWYNQVQGGWSLVRFLAGSGFAISVISCGIGLYAILRTAPLH